MSSEKQKDVKPSPEGKAENNESKENEKPQLTERQLKRLARRKNKDRKRELKHILLGSYFTLEDGRMASGGCVRNYNENVAKLWKLPMKTRVVIY